jgi:benzodiazapine receptor
MRGLLLLAAITAVVSFTKNVHQQTHSKLRRNPKIKNRSSVNALPIAQSSSSLLMASDSWNPDSFIKSKEPKTMDWMAVLNYLSATFLQYGLILTFLHIFQIKGLKSLKGILLPVLKIPVAEPVVAILMFSLSLRSRIFSPLTNSRPRASKSDPVFKERLRPSWMPPPLAFPIIWTTITFLRTIASTMIYKTTGTLLCPEIFAIMAHLSIGDTWNTINNVENRLGTAFGGVLFVWGSVMYTVYKYYKTLPLAGYILAPSALWLTVASYLVFSIWRLNYTKFNFPSVFPSKEEGPATSWRLPIFKF